MLAVCRSHMTGTTASIQPKENGNQTLDFKSETARIGASAKNDQFHAKNKKANEVKINVRLGW